MRKRQRWILNAALAVMAALLGARLRSDWERGNERYARLEAAAAAGRPAAVVPGPVSAPPVPGEVVSKNLFTPDRNNDRPRPAVPPSPAALPVVIGTLRLGAEYEALMAEAGAAEGQRFRRVKTGQQIGGYTLVEIRGDAVVVDYQGLRTTVNVYQSAKSVIRAAATAAPAASRPAAAPAPVVDTAASRPAYPPSVPTAAAAPAAPGASQASPYPGVRMIIEGNRRRFERDTMFGPQVWYEDIK